MKTLVRAAILMIVLGGGAAAQVTTDVLGSHNLAAGGPSPTTGSLPPCLFCHAPHSERTGAQPLWDQKLSTTTNYTLYSSTTLINQTQEPALGSASNLCLSCHDGTVAPGETTPYGNIAMSGTMNSQDVFGTNLQGVHPFNFALNSSGYLTPTPDLLPSLSQNGTTGNPAVKLINGNVQCISCHEPHIQAIDPVAQNFLVINNSGSALCLACHVTTPTVSLNASKPAQSNLAVAHAKEGTTVKFNGLSNWSRSIHAEGTYKVSKQAKQLGPYGNTRQNGCLSCHTPHNAPGGKQLLTGPSRPVPNMDAETQNCITCHDGGPNISPAIPNVFAEFAKAGHPFPTSNSQHSSAESAVLNHNRHTTCVDCHNPHAASQVLTFASAAIRPSQNGVIGVNAADGVSLVNPAVDQYENCLRCHGTSTGKQTLAVFGYLPTRLSTGGDPLNVIVQMNSTALSSHPVMRDRNSPFAQPSLLKFMWNLDGRIQGRVIASRILCSDCHNSDDNREFGGTGPNGPHGSKFPHILERRYEYSRVAPGAPPNAGPGSTIENLLPPVVDPAANGPYSLCAKCHDLANIMANASFTQHARHISAGFSCSVCHTAHGVGGASAGMSSGRLINFDLGVVAQNSSASLPISYKRSTNTCTLRCHNYNHNADGSVRLATGAVPRKPGH